MLFKTPGFISANNHSAPTDILERLAESQFVAIQQLILGNKVLRHKYRKARRDLEFKGPVEQEDREYRYQCHIIISQYVSLGPLFSDNKILMTGCESFIV